MYKKILKSTLMVSLLIPLAANAGTMTSEGDIAGAVFPTTVNSESEKCSATAKDRPVSDWVDAQGVRKIFFQPIPDYLGWTDNPFTIFALVDYAAVASRYLKENADINLGTKVTGSVKEYKCSDGTAKVIVSTTTENALGFAQSKDAALAYYPKLGRAATIFGYKATDVANGYPPAVGNAILTVSFMIPKAGGMLPDLVSINNNICRFVPYAISFTSTTNGTWTDTGTNAVMEVHEVASLSKERCEEDPTPNSPDYTIETIDIHDE